MLSFAQGKTNLVHQLTNRDRADGAHSSTYILEYNYATQSGTNLVSNVLLILQGSRKNLLVVVDESATLFLKSQFNGVKQYFSFSRQSFFGPLKTTQNFDFTAHYGSK